MISSDPLRERRLIEVQRRIACRIVLEDRYDGSRVAGVDQAFLGERIISASVVLDPSMQLIDSVSCVLKAATPYRAGYLSFREGAPAILAVRNLHIRPTLLFVDGCGINHPRRAGLACFVGVMLGMPTIGVSKNVLCGRYDTPEKQGEAEPLIHEGDVVGYALLSKKGCRPLIVAPGHMISTDSALDLTRRCLRGHKLPEPCRLAHEQARQIKVGLSQESAASP